MSTLRNRTFLECDSALALSARVLLIALVIHVLLSAHVWGQATAQIHGVVQDSSGAAIPGATVKATQTDTGVTRTVASMFLPIFPSDRTT